MTISSTTVRNSYSGDGTTDTFTYNFKIFQDSDIQVIIRSANGTETIKTITTHYTVTDAGVSAGGTVIFTVGNIPTATETVVLRRNIPQTQAIDYIANDPFPAESHEEGLDRATMAIQQIQEEVTRSLKLSKTNTMTSTEFTVGAADRANKILAFDAAGEISVTQELGTYKGTDTTITTEAYVQRDIVKSTSATQLNNVYICVGDSVVGDLLTDTDHFDLLVDAVSAAASATAAASSATDAETAQTAAETAQTAAELAETNAETAETNAETAETNAAASEANAAASEANAATSETNAATSETNAATSESNASTSASTATTQAGIATTQAGIATTQAGNASTSASNASTSESNAATSESNAATSESNAATSESNAATSESNAAASAAAAATAADNFDDVYLGSKASDPTLDNDGDALTAGDLYYNSVGTVLKYYTGSAWVSITSGGITDLVQDTSPQLGGMLDVNGQAIGDGTLELVKFAETASAVNEITVTNAATTAAPEISATGDDTDIDLKLTPKGAGKLNLDGIKFPNADGTANQILKTDGSGVLSFTDAFTGIAWQSVQTTGFTASAGNAYPCDTTSAGFTVTLPATPSAGQQVQIVDYAGTFDTNNLTIDPNGEDIVGQGSNVVVTLTGDREAITLTYIDSTQGWLPSSGINEGTDALEIPYSIDFLVIAGGASGGRWTGGGAGAGGYRTFYSISIRWSGSSEAITVTVGDGGASISSPASPSQGNDGSNSSISGSGLTTITSAGGGGGGGYNPPSAGQGTGRNGGSGGGAGGGAGVGGSGNTPNTSPSQGNNGGNNDGDFSCGGGGGANAIGGNGSGSTAGGNGGAGTASSITGSSITRAGGGGGHGNSTGGSGGAGGGGAGGAGSPSDGTPGTANTGSGGGGARDSGSSGAGGKGVVILSVPTADYSSTTTGSPTVTTSGSNTIMQFNGSGSYTA
jgi:hypothetical protein